MTEAEKLLHLRDAEYKRGSFCPCCDDGDLEPQTTEYEGYQVIQVMACLECLATWEEVYSLVGITNVKPSSLDR